MSDTAKLPVSLPSGVWALGMVSLLMDTSSEMIHSVLPVFLVGTLGASIMSIGLLEGIAEAVAMVLKVFSGTLSDWHGRRKPLVAAGYAMGALSKPIFALANTMAVVYGARIFDRIGKGIRGAPRDALVADITPPQLRGRAFGLRQALDSAGAVMGPAIALVLMSWLHADFRTLFWIAAIPAFLAVGTLLAGVREPNPGTRPVSVRKRMHFRQARDFSSSFWFVVTAGFILQLARFSEAFLILRAQDTGLALAETPLVLIVMNAVYAASAFPAGRLSDRIRREWLLIAGILILVTAQLVLGLGSGQIALVAGVTLWGLHLGLTQGILSALVADTAPAHLRGTAYGLFNLSSAGALLLASTAAGILWQIAGADVTFLTGAGFACTSLLAFAMNRKFWSGPSSGNS